MIRRPFVLVLLTACSGPAARVSIVPIGEGPCGRPTNATGLKLTAFGAGPDVIKAIPLGSSVTISDFPDDTQQLGVEVLVQNGEVGAAGKTAPLVFADLQDGATIPIFMAPLGGFCPVGAMLEPRMAPLVARAGAGVLVAGGIGTAGPLSTAELYDPSTATFSAVEVPGALQDPSNGLVGAVLTSLPDGRVVLTGGTRGVLTVFDPATQAFGPVFTIAPQRAFHAALALDATHVLVAGGCAGVDPSQQCQPPTLHSTFVYDLTGNQVGGPNLSPTLAHEGAQLYDTGVQLDGRHTLVLAGGFGDPGAGESFAIGDDTAVPLSGFSAQLAPLDGGGLLSAFVDDGTPPPDAGPVSALPPGGTGVVQLHFGPKLTGTRLVALEDGSVVGIGGDVTVAHYRPTDDAWNQEAPMGDGPGGILAPAVIRLPDGAVLVLGGSGAPSAGAWEYRPSLIGPTSGTVTALPATDAADTLTVPDPRTVTRDALGLTLTATDDFSARALVGGPRPGRGSVKVTLHDVAIGFALIAQQQAPGQAVAAILRDGELARLVRIAAGVESTICTGSLVTLATGPVSASLTIDGRSASVAIADLGILACDFGDVNLGAWGVSASGAGAHVVVDAVTASR